MSGGRLGRGLDGGELVQQAAALLGRLVAAGALSEETADLLWLDNRGLRRRAALYEPPGGRRSIP